MASMPALSLARVVLLLFFNKEFLKKKIETTTKQSVFDALFFPLILGHHSLPKPSVSNRILTHGGVDEYGNVKIMDPRPILHAFSVYVGNLPFLASKQWLYEIFVHFGEISDIFLSRKSKRPSSTHFTFIRCNSMDGDHEAIRALNGVVVEGCRLVVAKASDRKSSSKQFIRDMKHVASRGCFHHGTPSLDGDPYLA